MRTVAKRAARAILIDSTQLLLIKRSKLGEEPYWTAPGGGVEPDDATVQDGMVRELREELGAEVSGVQQVFLVTNRLDDERIGVQHFFVCRLEHLDASNRSGPEYTEPGRGAYDLDRVAPDADGRLPVELKPAELKAFVEANWAALVDAVTTAAANA